MVQHQNKIENIMNNFDGLINLTGLDVSMFSHVDRSGLVRSLLSNFSDL